MYPADVMFLHFCILLPEISRFVKLQVPPMVTSEDMTLQKIKNHYFDILLISLKITLPTPINLVIMMLLASNFGMQVTVVRFI